VISGRNTTQMTLILVTSFNTVATLPSELQVIEPAVGDWCQRLQLAFVLEEDIFNTCCNKNDVM